MFNMAKPLESDEPVPTPSKDFDAFFRDFKESAAKTSKDNQGTIKT